MKKEELLEAVRTLPKEEFVKLCLGKTPYSIATLRDCWEMYHAQNKTAK